MKPSDLTLLVVLGTADSAPATLEDIVAVACLFAPNDWAPPAEHVRLCAEAALSAGMLAAAPPFRPAKDRAPPDGMLQTTPVGRTTIAELLRLPIGPSCGEATRACMSAKLCFLHHLPPPERDESGNELAGLYRDALARLDCEQGPIRNPTSCCGGRQDRICLESELTWLDTVRRLRARKPPRGAADGVGNPLP